MPARSKQKWLTVDSLKQGLGETAAVQRDDQFRTATLKYDAASDMPFIVRRETWLISTGMLTEQHSWWFDSLDDAREQWKSASFAIRS